MTVPGRLRDAVLLDFIRDVAGLQGTKFGCGIWLCGACTVHINGTAARSCQLPKFGTITSERFPTLRDVAQKCQDLRKVYNEIRTAV